MVEAQEWEEYQRLMQEQEVDVQHRLDRAGDVSRQEAEGRDRRKPGGSSLMYTKSDPQLHRITFAHDW